MSYAFNRRLMSAFSLALVALVWGSAGEAKAQSTWNVASGNWSATGSWTPATVPNGIGATAQYLGLVASTATSATTTVDTSIKTIGTLTFGGSAAASWTITPTFALTFNQDGASSGTATLQNTNTNTGTTNALIIAAGGGNGIVLADDLLISNTGGSTNGTGAIQIVTAITGTGNVTFNNTGSSAASNLSSIRITVANSFTGSVLVKAGTVSYNSATVFGNSANVVTLGQSGSTSATIHGSAAGAIVANPITVAAGNTGTLMLSTASTSNVNFFTNTITLNSNVTINPVTLTANVSMGISGVVTGSAGVIKIGAGTATLSNTNTFQGVITVNAGQLILSGTHSTPSAVTVNSGGTLTLSGAAGALTSSTSSGITVNSGGTLAISDTTVNANRINDSIGLTLNGGTFSYTGNASTASTETIGSLTVSGAAAVATAGTVNPTVTFGSASNPSIARTNQGVLAVTGTGTIAVPGTVSGATNTVIGWATFGATPVFAIQTGSNIIGGLTTFEDSSNAGSWASGANVRVGGQANVGTVAATSTTPTTLNSLTYQFQNTLDLALLTGGTLTISSGGILSTANAGITNGTIKTGLDSAGGADLIFTTSAATTFTADSVIADGTSAPSSGLTKAGAGTLILSRNNTYTGPTTVWAGTIQVGNAGTAGSLGTGTVNLFTGSTLTFNRTDSGTIAGVVSGTGTLGVQGGGTLNLTGANTLTGATTIASGSTLSIGNGGSTGSLANSTITVNGSLTYNRTGGLFQNTALSGAGPIRVTGGATITLAVITSTAYSGVITIDSGSAMALGDLTVPTNSGGISNSTASFVVNGTLQLNRTQSILTTFNSAISGTGTIVQNGTGFIYTLGGNLTGFTGTIQAASGTIRPGTTTTNPLGENAALITNPAGRFQLVGVSTTIGSLSGTGGNIGNGGNNALTSTLTVGTLNTSTQYAGRMFNNTLNGGTPVFAIVKTGTGVLTLNNTVTTGTASSATGPNDYSGGTTINGGSIEVNTPSGVTGLGTGAVAVNNGGTLAGTGSVVLTGVNTIAVASGGKIAPGTVGTPGVAAGTGTLSVVAPTTFASGSAFQVGITTTPTPTPSLGVTGASTAGTLPNPTTNTFLNVTGTLTVDPTMNIVIDGTNVQFTDQTAYSYVVGQASSITGLTAGSTNGITADARFTPIGFAFVPGSANFFIGDGTANGGAANTAYVNFTAAVPEPTTIFGLATAGLGLAGWVKRRRNRSQV